MTRWIVRAAVAAVCLALVALPSPAWAGSDSFASAPLHQFSSVLDTGSTASATTEAGEPKGAAWPNGPHKTHWITWQAPLSGTATVTTCGSSFDTMLAAWTGTTMGNLQPVGSSDDGFPCPGFGVAAGFTFTALAGRRYRIQIDGFSGASGSYQLNVSQPTGAAGNPPHNNLGSATTISGATVDVDTSNSGATKQPGENDHDGKPAASTSIWYSWTPPTGGDVVMTTCGSGIDTVLAVYTGSAFPLTPVVSNDDATTVCPSTQSVVTFPARLGVNYKIAVAGFNGAQGYAELHLAQTPETTPPETTITEAPTGITGPSGSNFEFIADEAGSTFGCSLDSAAFEPCTSPKSYPGLASGSHHLLVKATDIYGNTDPVGAERTWTVDATPPTVPTIDSGPSGTVASTSASFEFSDIEVDATCSLDGAAPTPCTSPKDYTGLSQGPHTFAVRSLDSFANASDPATSSWTVDTVAPPVPTIDSGPTGTVSSATAGFAFSDTEVGASFECRIDGGSFGPCTSPAQYTGLGEGAHTFEVRAKDGVANTSAAVSRTWTVDTVAPPIPTIASGPTGFVASTGATFTFTGSESGATLECRVDATAFGPCTSPLQLTGLGQGPHTVELRAKDAVGNASPTAARTWTVDTAVPDTTVTAGPPKQTTKRKAKLAFTSPEPGVTFMCKLDKGPWKACASGIKYKKLTKGKHKFQVVAVDPAGNVDGTPAKRKWKVV